MGNWEGFDMDHAAVQQFDYTPQHMGPIIPPSMRDGAGIIDNGMELADMVSQTLWGAEP